MYVYLHALQLLSGPYISYACMYAEIYVTSLIVASILKYRGSKHLVGNLFDYRYSIIEGMYLISEGMHLIIEGMHLPACSKHVWLEGMTKL